MAAELPLRLKQQLGAILEIAPNRDIAMVKEAIENGFYRGGISLLDAQKALLAFNDFKELETGLKTKDTYNPDDFNKFLTGLMENKGALFERAKLAFWNNDLKYLDPTIPDTAQVKPLTGELLSPRPPTPEPMPPLSPAPVYQPKKPTSENEAQNKAPNKPKQETPQQNPDQPVPPRKKAKPQPQQQQMEQQLSQENQPQPTDQLTETNPSPLQARLNKLPQRPIQSKPSISKVSRRVLSAPPPRFTPPTPPIQLPQTVRSAGLNMSSGTQILARKGLTRGLGGLGSIAGNLPSAVTGLLGLGGGSPPGRPGGGIPGFSGNRRGRFPRPDRRRNFTSLIKKASIRGLIVSLFIFGLFAAVVGLFTLPGATGCPGGSITITKQVTNATRTVDFFAIGNGQSINYAITVQGSCGKDFTVEDTLPENVEPVPLSPSVGVIVEGRKLIWKFPNLTEPKTLTFSVIPKEADSWVINEAKLGFSISGGAVSPGGRIIDSQSRTFAQVLTQASGNVDMPPALLKAILKTEAGAVLDYSEEEFIRFSTPGWWEGADASSIKRGYAYNTCDDPTADCGAGNDVRGVAQFELATWKGIAPQLQSEFADGHEPDRRNARDAIFGSAILNKRNAESYAGTSNVEWTEDVIRAMARMYCAGSGAGRNPELARRRACGWNGSMGYDDFVWRDYQIFLGQV